MLLFSYLSLLTSKSASSLRASRSPFRQMSNIGSVIESQTVFRSIHSALNSVGEVDGASSETASAMDDASEATSTIIDNARIVRQRSFDAAVRRGVDPASVRLVAVSKTKPSSDIQSLYDQGFRCFGENYVQELLDKASALPTDICWHFIGHLQSSKASKLVKEIPNLSMIETVDSERLATKLNTACLSVGRRLPVLVQVDTSGEDTKSGVDADQLLPLVGHILSSCPHLLFRGLMTIGAPSDTSCFDKLVESRQRVADMLLVDSSTLELSMGMSGDFEAAIERGATNVRVGSIIFGPRLYPEKT